MKKKEKEKKRKRKKKKKLERPNPDCPVHSSHPLPRPPALLVGMNDDDPKMFSDFFSNLQKWSLGKINMPLFGKKMRKKI